MTKTEKYIKAAIKEEAKNFKQTHINNCHVEMPVNVGDAVIDVAQALKAQAEANEATAEALKMLCAKIGETKAVAMNFEA